MWKSGAEWQQLGGRRSGLKPCGEQKVGQRASGGKGVTVTLLHSDILDRYRQPQGGTGRYGGENCV